MGTWWRFYFLLCKIVIFTRRNVNYWKRLNCFVKLPRQRSGVDCNAYGLYIYQRFALIGPNTKLMFRAKSTPFLEVFLHIQEKKWPTVKHERLATRTSPRAAMIAAWSKLWIGMLDHTNGFRIHKTKSIGRSRRRQGQNACLQSENDPRPNTEW